MAMQQNNGLDVGHCAIAIAAALAANGGECAATRRMRKEGTALFARMIARLGIKPQAEKKWLRITRMLALLTPPGTTGSIHQKGRALGTVMADGGDASAAFVQRPAISEARVARLLAARGPARVDALERIVRTLARTHPKIDVTSIAGAVLHSEGRTIARDYYARIDSADKPSPTEEKNND